jgi:hypothetical protein
MSDLIPIKKPPMAKAPIVKTFQIRLVDLMRRPVFLIADILGIAALLSANLLPAAIAAGLSVFGSAMLTIGLTLPIGTYYQLRANADALKILDSCNRAGISAIFVSRLDDSYDLRQAIDDSFLTSQTLKLMGIAFRSLFGTGNEYTPIVRAKIDDPKVKLKVLMLNPESEAAERRARVEEGNATIEEIKYTLRYGLPATLKERLRRSVSEEQLSRIRGGMIKGVESDFAQEIIDKSGLEVRTYDFDPITFLLISSRSILTEQYHLGRPEGLRSGNCVGKHIPVLMYKRGAKAAAFLESHFEYVWANSTDRMPDILKEAVKDWSP